MHPAINRIAFLARLASLVHSMSLEKHENRCVSFFREIGFTLSDVNFQLKFRSDSRPYRLFFFFLLCFSVQTLYINSIFALFLELPCSLPFATFLHH